MRSTWMLAGILLALATTGGVERKASKMNNEANELFTKEQFDAAAKRYGDAQTRAPESPEIAYNLGNALYRQGRAQDALPLLLQGTQSPDPKLRQKSLYNLGNALHQTGKLQEAVGAYRQSLALDPADRDAKVNYEKALRELQQQQQQQQQQGNGQKNEQQNQGQNQQDQSGQGNSQQDSQQQGQQSPDGKNQEQRQEQQGKEGEPKDGEQKDPQEANQEPQQAGGDTLAAGDLSREEAMRILEAMRQQESELQKAKARQQKMRTRRVDKDW